MAARIHMLVSFRFSPQVGSLCAKVFWLKSVENLFFFLLLVCPPEVCSTAQSNLVIHRCAWFREYTFASCHLTRPADSQSSITWHLSLLTCYGHIKHGRQTESTNVWHAPFSVSVYVFKPFSSQARMFFALSHVRLFLVARGPLHLARKILPVDNYFTILIHIALSACLPHSSCNLL